MIDKVYSDKIVKYAADIPLQIRLIKPDANASKRSVFCGSKIEIDINVNEGFIIDFGQQISACALGSTAASIVARNVIGASFNEIEQTHKQMLDMLKNEGKPPTGRFSELEILQSVGGFPNRHTSTMLVLDALVLAIDSLKKE